MTLWSPATTRLAEQLARTARGPRREGVFALWLVTRVAEDLAQETPAAPKSRQRRLEALERRLATLTVPAPVRRALIAALAELAQGTPEAAAAALHQLTAPARDALGPETGDALALAAKAARAR
ncbi:MAG TPA: hypothetical protein VFS07_07265 [Gemmatimonadales bacterium]|jgi:hypothetical protein|nr:hypothetical protein [Gemmatimonadales bacterium]